MWIKTTWRFILYLLEWLRLITEVKGHADKGVEQGEYSSIAGGSENLYNPQKDGNR